MSLGLLISEHWPYIASIALMLIGLHGMLLRVNLFKKLIGMNIFQGAIILFFIVHAYKDGASVPVHDATLGTAASAYMNPIPHGLMLTAIVVSVAITGVGLAILILIHRNFGSLDEPELLERLRTEP